ncbi:MAG: CDGSH iron-sulfur domain-containing protein, partial [Paracoccaceae bacterium]|nr:CDGSH iron-sulfur domain-containing protein [Paracoccaceae bacterium]
MDKQYPPIIAGKKPIKANLEVGKNYFWCQCGRYVSQAFYDGSHRGTTITSLKFTAEKNGNVALCQCKASKNAPFCDGSHAKLGSLEVGAPTPKPSLKAAVFSAVPTPEEPTVARIHELALHGLS